MIIIMIILTIKSRIRTEQGRARCKFRALYDAHSVVNIPRGDLDTRVNPDTYRVRVGVEIFESGKKTLRIQKYPDTLYNFSIKNGDF